MVVKQELITERLIELDTVLTELARYRGITTAQLKQSLSQRWIVERGLMAAANLIFDVADHILSGQFGLYPETYESSLELLADKGIITQELYQDIKGLGGLRNLLVHEYARVDVEKVPGHLNKALTIFPRLSQAIQRWLEQNPIV